MATPFSPRDAGSHPPSPVRRPRSAIRRRPRSAIRRRRPAVCRPPSPVRRPPLVMDVLRTVFSWRRKNVKQSILEELPQKKMKLHEEKKDEEETSRRGKGEDVGEKNKKKKNLTDYEYTSGEDDDYVWPDGTRRRTREEWARYYKQIEESEGFDVDPFPGTCELGLIGVEDYDSESIIKCAKAAIEHFNNENYTSYEFLKLEKITCCIAAGFEFRLTFQAVDGEAEPKMFQAITFLGIDDSIIVDLCRLKSIASS